jgi:hypothetical protein
VVLDRREAITPTGEQCLWEAERLAIGGEVSWPAEAPEGEAWCTTGFEVARTVDILGRDGPFVSTVVADVDASGAWTRRCITWDVRSGAPTTIDAWSFKLAPTLWASAADALASPAWVGWTTDRESFVLRGGHVSFCVARDGEMAEIPVR